MNITISDEVPFVPLVQALHSINCQVVNDGKGGLIIRPNTKSGNCDLCGDWSGELTAGACPFCQTRYPESVSRETTTA